MRNANGMLFAEMSASYGVISRPEQHGWMAPLPADDCRRPYKLTREGQRVLRARLESLRVVARVGQARLADV